MKYIKKQNSHKELGGKIKIAILFRMFMYNMRLRSNLLNTILLATNLIWSTKNGNIYNQTTPYIIRGTNWHGIESDCNVPHGLWANSMKFYFDFLQGNGFNSIRTPVSYEVMINLNLPVLDSCLDADPQYKGLTVGDFYDKFLENAERHGMSVLADQHTILGKIQDYPWAEGVSGNDTISAWINFLKRYGNRLFAIELKNEPHNDCSLREYFLWCSEAIKRIENETDFRGLYFISGVQLTKKDGNKNHAWGGSYEDLDVSYCNFPLNRIVFCPHVYGTSVRSESVGSDGKETWDNDFGFIKNRNWELKDVPIIFSEMGGYLTGSDLDFYKRFKDYAHNEGLTAGLYWWSLPSTSVDTGGLIQNDFQTFDWNKINYIKEFIPNPTCN